MQQQFHLRVRAIIRNGDRVLLARMKGKPYSFLPGGHYEVGETLAQTLVRELQEELGVQAAVKRYLGVVENGWSEDGEYHYEVNHLFEAEASELRTDADPVSREEHLEFLWSAQEDFERYDLRPVMTRPLIAKLLRGDASVWYESNF